MDAKDMLLTDALAVAIESEKKIIKLKRVIAILVVIIIILLALVIGG